RCAGALDGAKRCEDRRSRCDIRPSSASIARVVAARERALEREVLALRCQAIQLAQECPPRYDRSKLRSERQTAGDPIGVDEVNDADVFKKIFLREGRFAGAVRTGDDDAERRSRRGFPHLHYFTAPTVNPAINLSTIRL